MKDFNDFLVAHGPEAIAQLLSNAATHESAASSDSHEAKPKIELIRFDELSLATKSDWVIKGLLTLRDLSLLYGAPGSGKSFLAVDLAMHVALGIPWRGLRVARGGVLYVGLEGGRGLKTRFLAQRLIHQSIEGTARVPLWVCTTSLDLCASPKGAQILARAAREAATGAGVSPTLIIIDTLSRAMGSGDENNPRDMGLLVRNCALMQEQIGAHVMLVHHQGKDAGRGPRGHSSLNAAADTAIEVTRDESTKTSTARLAKQKDGETGAGYCFRLVQVEIGKDEDGEPITTCYVEHVGGGESRPRKRLSAQQKRGLELLEQAVIDHGQPAPRGNAHIPDDVLVVPIEVWREACLKGGLSDSERPDAFRQAFNRMKLSLHTNGVIGEWEGKVWICKKWRDSVTSRDMSVTRHASPSVTDVTPPLKGCHGVTAMNGASNLKKEASDFDIPW